MAAPASNRSGGRQGKLAAAQLMSRTVGVAVGSGGQQAKVEGRVKIAIAKSPKVVLKQRSPMKQTDSALKKQFEQMLQKSMQLRSKAGGLDASALQPQSRQQMPQHTKSGEFKQIRSFNPHFGSA